MHHEYLQRTRKTALVLAGLFFSTSADAVTCGSGLSPLDLSASAINFGTYDASEPAATTATGSIVIDCRIGADVLPAFTVSLSRGHSSTFEPRTMISGTSSLFYNIYLSASYSTIWGDGSGATGVYSNSGLLMLNTITLPVYGRVPAGQYVEPGIYSDTITVTVTY